ncbi:hypothetical protein ACTI_61810 [Actinoplanes sp. OR16]|uniref:hypothetical protein n=1 Tax=Actinoplanes sp. OR16 TaxID=946334 RepID=UPI000F6DE672|nr:hypothetical protein [Actinoplanes sp. OR16]BBH69496.1 hypothetical protein ACTI_61810 [Actinoplanes sp. OR16]
MFISRVLAGDAAIGEAKRLQGRAHVRYGHLAASSLTPDGWLPWHDRVARWFGVYAADGRLAAVASKISRGSAGGVIEASGVAKAAGVPLDATLVLYRAMYHDSLDRGERVWVMTVIPPVRAVLERFMEGGIVVSPRTVEVAELHPEVRPGVVVHPAWGVVDGFTDRIRAAGDASSTAQRRDLLYAVAARFEDRALG